MTDTRDLTAERDAEVLPLVRKLLVALASREDLMMGSSSTISADKAAEYYQKVYLEVVVPLLLESNIKLNAIPYVFSVILQPFQLLNDVVTSSFEMNRDLADSFKYGIGDIDDLRVLDLDAALKTGVEEVKKRAVAKSAAEAAPAEAPAKKSKSKPKKPKTGDN